MVSARGGYVVAVLPCTCRGWFGVRWRLSGRRSLNRRRKMARVCLQQGVMSENGRNKWYRVEAGWGLEAAWDIGRPGDVGRARKLGERRYRSVLCVVRGCAACKSELSWGSLGSPGKPPSPCWVLQYFIVCLKTARGYPRFVFPFPCVQSTAGSQPKDTLFARLHMCFSFQASNYSTGRTKLLRPA